MKNKGQNLMEFGIILALVSFAGIIVLTAMGGNIKAMFTTSHDKYKEFKPFNWGGGPSSGTTNPSSGGPVSTNPDVITPDDDVVVSNPSGPSNTGGDFDVNSVPVKINSDGSASFTVKGQDVSIPASAMNDLNIVFGTAGSSGLSTEVMAAIQKLIVEHQSEYPAGDVPINLNFGTGLRNDNTRTSPGTYKGDATYNTVTASVGGHYIIVQKDQTLQNGSTAYMGIHSVEVKNSTGTISSVSVDPQNITKPPIDGRVMSVNRDDTVFNCGYTGDDGAMSWSFYFSDNNVSL